MKSRHSLLVIIFSLFSASLSADSWIGGFEVGFSEQTFNPHLTGPGGVFEFQQRGRGAALSLNGGYEFDLLEDFSIAALARGTWDSSEWDFAIPTEPATFRYEIPFNLGVSAQPRYQLIDPVSVFGEVGVQWGFIRQRKDGPITDGYNINEWRTGLVVGGGVEFEIDECVAVRFSYRHVWYESYNFQSVTGAGVPIWNVEDQPQVNNFSLAAVVRF